MSNKSLSDYEKVKQFTEEAGFVCPSTPQLMNRKEVEFLVKMVLSEMQELVDTVTDSHEESVAFMHNCVGVDPSKRSNTTKTEFEIIGEQADAAVDSYIYMLNAFCKKGVDLSKIFDIVHESNMAKRDPKTGKFIRRESDGKILKPEGWKAPDITAEIIRQHQHSEKFS